MRLKSTRGRISCILTTRVHLPMNIYIGTFLLYLRYSLICPEIYAFLQPCIFQRQHSVNHYITKTQKQKAFCNRVHNFVILHLCANLI